MSRTDADEIHRLRAEIARCTRLLRHAQDRHTALTLNAAIKDAREYIASLGGE